MPRDGLDVVRLHGRTGTDRTVKAKLRHAAFACFVGGVLAYGAAFAWRMLDRLDFVDLISDVNEDDSFYYFQIAWRLAQGEFSTFDGLSRTNGYHPLWLLLITPFYWFFDKTEALFAIKAFEIMLVAGGAALAAGAARVARLPWILLLAALPALYRQRGLFVGMEAAAGLFLLGAFLLAVCLFARDPARWRRPLAAVAFALPWVRLEYVAVAVAATAALCFVEWSDRFSAGDFSRAPEVEEADGRRSAPALDAAAPLLGAVAGILAYFAWNAAVFGGIVPVSAAAKAFLSQSDWRQDGGYSLARNTRAFLERDAFDDELLVALEICAYAALVWWFSRRSRGRDDRLLLAFLVGLFGLAAGHLAKFAQSVLTVHPGFGEYFWYFVPAYLMKALVVPARCYVAVWFVRRLVGPGASRAARISIPGIVAAGTVFLFATADFAAPFRFVDERREATSGYGQIRVYLGATAANRLLPEDAVIASGASGVLGYFSRFPVVNLDGVVNSWDYLRARRNGTDTAFRQRYGITHFVDVLPVDRGHRRFNLFEGPRVSMRPVQFKLWLAGGGGSEVMERGRRAEWFRERMEPWLERQADGVGLVVDGRLAQAFSWDCPGGMAAWTWAGQGGTAVVPWTRTSIGFCASAVVLPHDARPPVRVETLTVGEYLADRVGGRRPAIESGFDVHLVENTLIYAKDRCGPDDVAAPFFLHVDPVDPDDLPGPRRRHGFDNLDFRFGVRGTRFGGTCVAEVPLPEYGVAAIRTGQYVEAGGGFHHPWEGEIRLGPD